MGWSEALPELLDVVAQKHMDYYEDYLSFSGVCKSWHSIAVQAATKVSYSNGLPSRLPSLLLAEEKEDVEFRQLFFLSNKSIRKIRLPEAYGKYCVPSSGWLITVGYDTATKLINPLSRETIDLPKIDTFPEFLESSERDFGIRKLLFFSQSPVVVVLWGCSCRLGFCRSGDNKWTSIETGWGGMIKDITCYDGRVYYFESNYHIRSCDVYGKDPVIVDVSRLPKYFYNEDLVVAYILGLDDEDDGRKKLLVVIRELLDELTDDDDDGLELWCETYKTKSFQVFEYDLENGKWSKVNDLGKKTLFVGFSSSFWIEDTSGVIKGNCIYYTDDLLFYRGSKNGAGRDMGIYHMCDVVPHFIGESCSKLTPPIWLQSM